MKGFVRASKLHIKTLSVVGRVRPFVQIPTQDVSYVARRGNSNIVQDERPFRMAVLGSGPAGFYTAYKVMSSIGNAIVDMYEYLPVPFGLVRYGVAPDHPEVKVSCHILRDRFLKEL